MDVSSMTIEGFFLADYMKQKDKIEELEDKVRYLQNELDRYYDQYGVTDLHTKTQVVRYDVVSSYTIKNYFKFTKDELEKAISLDDEQFYDFALNCKPKKDNYSTDRLIRRTETTYLYTVHVKESRTEYDAYFDGAGGYVKKIANEAGIDCEVPLEFDAQSKKYAIDYVRESLQEELERIEGEDE